MKLATLVWLVRLREGDDYAVPVGSVGLVDEEGRSVGSAELQTRVFWVKWAAGPSSGPIPEEHLELLGEVAVEHPEQPRAQADLVRREGEIEVSTERVKVTGREVELDQVEVVVAGEWGDYSWCVMPAAGYAAACAHRLADMLRVVTGQKVEVR